MSKRRSARELALKILFQVEVGKFTADEALETSFEQVNPPPEDREYAAHLVQGVVKEETDLDQIIANLAQGWSLDRLAKVDKNVLRVALFELIHTSTIPPNVVINDAVEIVKKYSTDDSGRFVNGILGNYVRRRDSSGGEGTESRTDADE